MKIEKAGRGEHMVELTVVTAEARLHVLVFRDMTVRARRASDAEDVELTLSQIKQAQKFARAAWKAFDAAPGAFSGRAMRGPGVDY